MFASRLSSTVRGVAQTATLSARRASTASKFSAGGRRKPTSLLVAAGVFTATGVSAISARYFNADVPVKVLGFRVAEMAPRPTAARSPAFKQAISQADLSFSHRGEDGNLALAYTLLRGVYEEAERNHDSGAKAELCWRLARTCYNLRSSKDPRDIELYLKTAENKKELGVMCERYAKEAVDVAPDHYRGHYWIGIAIQTVGEDMGTKASIKRLVSDGLARSSALWWMW